MIGASTPMRALFAALPRISAATSPLLIRGERGAGKKLIARAVHTLSDRSRGPFETVDCSAASDMAVRAALFASIQSAKGGTLVLDGIGELSVDLQAQLLRDLRTGDVDVRIISTTDTDLERQVESGRFREALYYQLNLLSIKAPPLRERGRDVQLLADFFLGEFTSPGSRRRVVGFSAEARLAMQQWSWPGNVRELVNRIKNAIVMCEKGPLSSADLGLDGRMHGRAAIDARGSPGGSRVERLADRPRGSEWRPRYCRGETRNVAGCALQAHAEAPDRRGVTATGCRYRSVMHATSSPRPHLDRPIFAYT